MTKYKKQGKITREKVKKLNPSRDKQTLFCYIADLKKYRSAYFHYYLYFYLNLFVLGNYPIRFKYIICTHTQMRILP